jgi:dihydroxy-acid dehydratase
VRNGDRLRVDLRAGRVDLQISDADMQARREALEAAGGYAYPASQTPWQEIQRAMVSELATGAVLNPAVKYHRIIDTRGPPRDNH